MKRLDLSFFAGFLLVICSVHAEEASGIFDFKGAPPENLLSAYEELSGLELIISSHVRALSTPINLKTERTVSRNEAEDLIKRALLLQAGIVITRLDEKRASVTYNDALPGPGQMQLYFRVIKVDPNSFAARLKDATSSKENRPIGLLLITYLRQKEISFPPPESCFYTERDGTIVLRANRDKLDKTEALLSELSRQK